VQSLGDIRRLLAEHGLSPRKALGQNFLVDQNLLAKLVAAASLSPGERVLEVGPGTGVLTEELLARGCEVVACELDAGLAALLRDRLGDDPRFVPVEGDCLDRKRALNPEVDRALTGAPFKLVANLPYGAASPLIALLATVYHPVGGPGCLGQYVTVQREVAQRLRAGPGGRDYGELSVVVRAMCTVRSIARLGPACFWPRPKVESEMLAIEPLAQPLSDDPESLMRACRLLFTKRRKQVGRILTDAGVGLDPSLDIDARARPEDLSIEQIAALAPTIETER